VNGAAASGEVDRLLELIGGKWTTQAVGVAAELGIAEALAQGPRDAVSLARDLGCDAGALYRLLRALCSVEVCREEPEGRFAVTPMGAMLQPHAQPSLHAWALWTARHQWSTWSGLADSVRTGQSVRKLASGRDGYDRFTADPEGARLFNRAMVETTRLVAAAVVNAVDFASARRVIDVGGGYGELLAAILRAHPHLSGFVYDLPHAGDGAVCDFRAGDFFESVPVGADLHVLKSVLHNWPDAQCAAILGNCRAALPPGGRVAVIERVMPERVGREDRALVRGDLNMLVGLGGRERTLAELGGLLAAAALPLVGCTPIGLGFSVVEGCARSG
jgi:hypothetical protein